MQPFINEAGDYILHLHYNEDVFHKISVKRSDVTGNDFEWELNENKDPLLHTSLY